jgi:hypothetical protein
MCGTVTGCEALALGVASRTVQRRWGAALRRLHSLLKREQDDSPGSPAEDPCHASDRPAP